MLWEGGGPPAWVLPSGKGYNPRQVGGLCRGPRVNVLGHPMGLPAGGPVLLLPRLLELPARTPSLWGLAISDISIPTRTPGKAPAAQASICK